MRLYVVKRLYDYEGFDIIGIYDNLTDANKAIDDIKYIGDGITIDDSFVLNRTNKRVLE